MKPGTIALNNASLRIGYSGLAPPHQRGFMREITDFFVPESCRGKGEGSALLQDVCDQADQEGLLLLIKPDTLRLENFYAKHGFKRLPTDNEHVFMLRMPKKLQRVGEVGISSAS